MDRPAHILPMTAHADAVIGGGFAMTFELFADTDQEQPADLSKCAVTMTIGDLFTLTKGSGLTIDAKNGVVVAELDDKQTGSVVWTAPEPVHHYVLRVEPKQGFPLFPVVGDITFHRP